MIFASDLLQPVSNCQVRAGRGYGRSDACNFEILVCLYPALHAVGHTVPVIVIRGAPPEIGLETEIFGDVLDAVHPVRGYVSFLLVEDKIYRWAGDMNIRSLLFHGECFLRGSPEYRVRRVLRKFELFGGHDIPSRDRNGGLFGFHVNVQEILGPGFISYIPQGNRELPVSPGGQIHRGKCPGVYGFRVGQYGIFNRVLIQVREVVPVIYPDNSSNRQVETTRIDTLFSPR